MNLPLTILGCGVAFAAALVHVYIFVLESLLWRRPSTRRVFGVSSEADAETLRPMAYNQGFYNLFLALGVIVGLLLLVSGDLGQAGFAVILFALASMVLAALVLLTSNRRMLRPALIQGAAPAVAILALVLAAVLG